MTSSRRSFLRSAAATGLDDALTTALRGLLA
jgi:hypothetical protein